MSSFVTVELDTTAPVAMSAPAQVGGLGAIYIVEIDFDEDIHHESASAWIVDSEGNIIFASEVAVSGNCLYAEINLVNAVGGAANLFVHVSDAVSNANLLEYPVMLSINTVFLLEVPDREYGFDVGERRYGFDILEREYGYR